MWKTIALWVVLIIFFVAFYNVFAQPVDPNAPREVTTWQSVASWSVPLIFFGAIYVWFKRAQRRTQPTHDGVALLHEGRYSEALAVFEKLRIADPKQPIFAYNCGVARMQLWQLEAALKELELVRTLTKGKLPALATLLPEQLALTYALLGRSSEAAQALATLPAGKGDSGRITLASGLLLMRSGDFPSARLKLGSFEVKQLGGVMGALARTAEAFCIEKASGELRHVNRVGLFGETGADSLRKAWPELVAFIERAPAW